MRMPAGHRARGAMTDPAEDLLAVAVEAVQAAADAGGWAREAWERPQRHAFAVLAFGIVSAAAARHEAAEQTTDLAVDVLRQATRLPFREARATVDAIVDAITGDRPHPAVQSLVRCGWMAGEAWLRGARGEFDALVVQATASDGFVSDRPLL